MKNPKEEEVENQLIADAIAAGKVTKCPPAMAHEALQFGAKFMRDGFGDMVVDLATEYVPPVVKGGYDVDEKAAKANVRSRTAPRTSKYSHGFLFGKRARKG